MFSFFDILKARAEIARLKAQLALLQPPLPPAVRRQVDGNFIFSVINNVKPSATHIYLSDSQYWLCSENDINTFLKVDTTNKMGYVPEERDCDDFSYRLMGQLSIPSWSGIAFGIVWTNLHALNCLIDDTSKFWFIEPQSDKLQEKLEPWQGSEILFILM